MESSHVTSHLMLLEATSDHRLDVLKPAGASILPAEIKHADELEFEETEVNALFKKKKYNGHMYVEIASNMSKATVSVFNTGDGPNPLCPSLVPVKWRGCIHPAHYMFVKPASNNPVKVINQPCFLLSWVTYMYVSTSFSWTIAPYSY